MPDVFQVANAFVTHVQQSYPQEVAIIAYYGSYALGAASPGSDLDLYYIPATEKAGGLYRSFCVAGVPFEFWPVSWEFAEKIASGRHHWSVAASILANARLLYSRSEADLSRFEALRAQIARLQTPAEKDHMLDLAWEAFQPAAFHLESLRLACARQDLLGARWMGCKLVNAVLDCLCLVNQTYFQRDWTSDLEPVRQLAQQPEGTLERIESLATGGSCSAIQEAAEGLYHAARQLLLEKQNTQPLTSLAELFSGYLAALGEYTHKTISACERHNLVKASYWASQMQVEVASMLAQVYTQPASPDHHIFSEYSAYLSTLGWPDLAQAITTRDFDLIAAQTQAFANRVREFLCAQGVPSNEFAILQDALGYISGENLQA